MKQVLAEYLGKTIEIHYGGPSAVRGTLETIVDGVARLKDEEGTIFYVALDKIHACWEVREKEKPLGFVVK